ncbi:MAG: hypothetical protein VKJ44_02560 [Synechococcus sp.]|nr:hypothetical protein [Synechococcus sp.]
MEPRRLVVWIAASILGFQGGTLALDLLNCTVLSWLYVRRYGLERVEPSGSLEQRPPAGLGGAEAVNTAQPQAQAAPSTEKPPTQSGSGPVPLDPTEVFCDRPRNRVDEAVSQGLSILAGLALGGSVGGGGKAGTP